MIKTKIEVESDTTCKIKNVVVNTYQTGIFDFSTYIEGDKNAYGTATDEKQALENHVRAIRKAYKREKK